MSSNPSSILEEAKRKLKLLQEAEKKQKPRSGPPPPPTLEEVMAQVRGQAPFTPPAPPEVVAQIQARTRATPWGGAIADPLGAELRQAQMLGGLGIAAAQRLIPGGQDLEERFAAFRREGFNPQEAAQQAFAQSPMPSVRVPEVLLHPGGLPFNPVSPALTAWERLSGGQPSIGVKGALELAADPLNLLLGGPQAINLGARGIRAAAKGVPQVARAVKPALKAMATEERGFVAGSAEEADRVVLLEKMLAAKGKLPTGEGPRQVALGELGFRKARQFVGQNEKSGFTPQEALASVERELQIAGETLQSRSAPFGGRMKNISFPGITTAELDAYATELQQTAVRMRAALQTKAATLPQTGVIQAGMEIGERPAQGGLFENLRGEAQVAPLADQAQLAARASRQAEIARGQAEMSGPPSPIAAKAPEAIPPVPQAPSAVAPRATQAPLPGPQTPGRLAFLQTPTGQRYRELRDLGGYGRYPGEADEFEKLEQLYLKSDMSGKEKIAWAKQRKADLATDAAAGREEEAAALADEAVPPPALETAVPPAVPPREPPKPPVATAAPEPGMPGEPKMNLAEANETLVRFGRFIASPQGQNAWDLTLAMRKKELGQRAGRLQARAQELVLQGKPAEGAIQEAMQEMAGKLPGATGGLAEDITAEMRQALFDKVYLTLKDEPFEMMSTAEALRHALLDKPIPRVPGTAGGSAWSRLMRVFADQPEVVKALDQPKSLGQVVNEAVLGSGTPPRPPEPRTYPPNVPFGQPRLGEGSRDILHPRDLRHPDIQKYEIARLAQAVRQSQKLPIPLTSYELPIQTAARQAPLMPATTQHFFIRGLKEAGMATLDISNAVKAVKSSVDFSFWRQVAPLIVGHSRAFARANGEGLAVLYGAARGRTAIAKQAWERITKDPLYELYENVQKSGGGRDFLRQLEIPKGGQAGKGAEEFGYIGGNRPIPRFMAKVPLIKQSQEAFVTSTNSMTWSIWKKFYQAQLKINQRIAEGKIVLKPGEVFDMEANMVEQAKYLADLSGRGGLGHFAPAAESLSGGLFAPRYAMGRFLSPRHLFSTNPYVRKEAWRDATLFVGTFGAILALGYHLGLWDVEIDPRSSDFAKIRVGKTRIDPWGGYQQFARLIAQVATNTGVASDTGQPYRLDPQQALLRFARGKASPLASLAADLKTGKTYIGEDVNLKDPGQWVERVAPLTPWDIYEVAAEQSLLDAALVAGPAIVGAGVSTYGFPDWKADLKEYFAIPPAGSKRDIEKQKNPALQTRDAYLVDNPGVNAQLFILGDVPSFHTDTAVYAALRLIKETGIDPTQIQAVKDYQKNAAIRAKGGLAPKSPTTPSQERLEYFMKQLGIPQPSRQFTSPTPTLSSSSILEQVERKLKELQEAGVR